MSGLNKIITANRDGWVLYYTDRCPHCKQLKQRVGRIKWAMMKKVNCDTANYCPVDGVPMLYNIKYNIQRSPAFAFGH